MAVAAFAIALSFTNPLTATAGNNNPTLSTSTGVNATTATVDGYKILYSDYNSKMYAQLIDLGDGIYMLTIHYHWSGKTETTIYNKNDGTEFTYNH